MAKANEKAKAISEINRALGWLEGISYGLEARVAAGVMDAVETIECALKEVLRDGKEK